MSKSGKSANVLARLSPDQWSRGEKYFAFLMSGFALLIGNTFVLDFLFSFLYIGDRVNISQKPGENKNPELKKKEKTS